MRFSNTVLKHCLTLGRVKQRNGWHSALPSSTSLCNTGSRNRKIPAIFFHTAKETLAFHTYALTCTQADVHTHTHTCMHAHKGHKASFLATPHELDETGLECESYTRLHLHSGRVGEGPVRGVYNKVMHDSWKNTMSLNWDMLESEHKGSIWVLQQQQLAQCSKCRHLWLSNIFFSWRWQWW